MRGGEAHRRHLQQHSVQKSDVGCVVKASLPSPSPALALSTPLSPHSAHPAVCSMTSGAIQHGVPTNVMRCVCAWPQDVLRSIDVATPKSPRYTQPLWSTRMLPACGMMCEPATECEAQGVSQPASEHKAASQLFPGARPAPVPASPCPCLPAHVCVPVPDLPAPACPCPCPPVPPYLDITVNSALAVHIVERTQHIADDGRNHHLIQALQAETGRTRGGAWSGVADTHACRWWCEGYTDGWGPHPPREHTLGSLCVPAQCKASCLPVGRYSRPHICCKSHVLLCAACGSSLFPTHMLTHNSPMVGFSSQSWAQAPRRAPHLWMRVLDYVQHRTAADKGHDHPEVDSVHERGVQGKHVRVVVILHDLRLVHDFVQVILDALQVELLHRHDLAQLLAVRAVHRRGHPTPAIVQELVRVRGRRVLVMVHAGQVLSALL
eukprot:354068-Chlamydomonas_euryale.AAC.7